MRETGKRVCVAGIGLVVVLSAATGIYHVIKNNPGSKVPTEPETDESKKLREDIANDIPDKNPNDIEIPEDAPEEEKQSLQEKKDYWTLIKATKDKISENLNTGKYEPKKFVRKINHIQIYEEKLYVEAEIIAIINANLESETRCLLLDRDELMTAEEYKNMASVSEYLNNPDFKIKWLLTRHDTNLELGEQLIKTCLAKAEPTFQDLIGQGYEYKMLDAFDTQYYEYKENQDSEEYKKEAIENEIHIEFSKGEEKIYMAYKVGYSNYLYKYNLKKLQEMKTDPNADFSDAVVDRCSMNIIPGYEKTKSLIQEEQNSSTKNDEAQAEIEEISTRDENGKVTGMDWNESQEKVEKKKAQNAAKLASQDAAMDYMPLYPDQELSL